MLGSKKIGIITLLLIVAALMFSVIAIQFPQLFSGISNEVAVKEEYKDKLFSDKVLNVNIEVDKSAWQEMLDNKMQKPYIPCDVEINGEKFDQVGIRPKGNSSLTSIHGERISYRLDFDHYVSNQSCFGLEQIVLNNLQADATYMKDYIAYDLMEYAGVAAPLHTYAYITINGEPFGVYLAAEVYEEDYLNRVYKDTSIQLYSVKSSGLDEFENAVVDPETEEVISYKGIEKASGMAGPGGPPPEAPGGMQPQMPPVGKQMVPPAPRGGAQPPAPQMEEGKDNNDGAPGMPPGGMGGGGDLVYNGDSTESYRTIFANAVSKDADAKDFAKVIKAIKYLNKEDITNEELEKYWNVDSILRYLAVHTFMVNGDSYTGGMMQNYYLAEQNGQITVLPWDYNLSFGSFGGGPGAKPYGVGEENAFFSDKTTEVINHAIDTPVFEVDMADRPLVSVLLGKEEYKEKYHKYLSEVISYASGDFINKLEILEKEIYPYIEKEKVAFYTPQEHKSAFEVLKKFLKLRCESIDGQLEGKIPSETALQKNSGALIKADFSIEEMGSMGGGPGGDMPPPPMWDNDTPQGAAMPMPPAPPGMPQGAAMPPPPGNVPSGENGAGMQGAPGKMMPPPGMVSGQSADIGGYVATIISVIVLCFTMLGVNKFTRKF